MKIKTKNLSFKKANIFQRGVHGIFSFISSLIREDPQRSGTLTLYQLHAALNSFRAGLNDKVNQN